MKTSSHEQVAQSPLEVHDEEHKNTNPFHNHRQENGGEKHRRAAVRLGADYKVPHDRGHVQRRANKPGRGKTEPV